jgi:glucuronate isomerase
MKAFLTENFLLHSKTAETLYHDYAAQMPIFDYHCHLPPEDIANDRNFENMTQIWLNGDHYKWRAMRASGIDEEQITGSAEDKQKFKAWAETVPKTVRNPLFHWTHLELRNPFGITGKLLNGDTWEEIYRTCNDLLQQPEFSVRGILTGMNVKVVCTTDDPLDDLRFHRQLLDDDSFKTRVLPAFRPDKAMKPEDLPLFNQWVSSLEQVTGHDINDVSALLAALEQRIEYFHQTGCRLSDHGVDKMVFFPVTLSEANVIYAKARSNQELRETEVFQFKSFMLIELAKMYADKGWTQQFHIGALRNANTNMFGKLGPDTGYDSMDDLSYAEPLSRFLNTLEKENNLAKTILYTLNPKDNEMLATMIGTFQNGTIPGKIQFGSGWWFNDQKDGMERQMNALSNMGLISQFVGMLTDSRSFLSYPRHEYFRRILCNLFGNDIENGELPNDLKLIGGIVQDICYNNAVKYFRF